MGAYLDNVYFGDTFLLSAEARSAGTRPIDQMLDNQGSGLLR